MSAQPIAVKVTRYKCPHCPRTAARPGRAREHMARCWFNPEARGCKTCKHFEEAVDDSPDPTIGYPGYPDPEFCAVGVSLDGRPACKVCLGSGETFDRGTLGISECPDCGGDGAEVKPGPIVHCSEWEAAE